MLNADLERDARAILAAHNLPCLTVVAVDRDSILYVNPCGKPRTAWLDQPAGRKLRVEMVTGFAAEPPDDWHGAPRPVLAA